MPAWISFLQAAGPEAGRPGLFASVKIDRESRPCEDDSTRTEPYSILWKRIEREAVVTRHPRVRKPFARAECVPTPHGQIGELSSMTLNCRVRIMAVTTRNQAAGTCSFGRASCVKWHLCSISLPSHMLPWSSEGVRPKHDGARHEPSTWDQDQASDSRANTSNPEHLRVKGCHRRHTRTSLPTLP